MSEALTPINSSFRPKVSVLLITYNHEKFVGQALQSILEQETNFSFEINVIEDCSTDKTRDVILQYKELYPDKINLYFNPTNVGSAGPYLHTQKVFFEGFKTLKGQYLAILEGDDYWTSPKKLQKQVDFLDSNPDFVGCTHNTVKIYDDDSELPHRFLYWPGRKEVFNRDDFYAMTTFFHSNSFLFRNVFNGIPPSAFRDRYSCDIFVTMAHVEYGKVRYFDEDMAVYRAHSGGCYSGLTAAKGRIFNINGLRRYNEWLRYKYIRLFALSIYCLSRELLNLDKDGTIGPIGWKLRLKYRLVMCLYLLILLVTHYPKVVYGLFKKALFILNPPEQLKCAIYWKNIARRMVSIYFYYRVAKRLYEKICWILQKTIEPMAYFRFAKHIFNKIMRLKQKILISLKLERDAN